MKILCRTLFDCSRTGTTGHFRSAQAPFEDGLGNMINTVHEWKLSRNQQRNFETIMQMISLRAQPTVTVDPQENQGQWRFEFTVETPGVYSANGQADDVSALLNECQGTPMILGLRETQTVLSFLQVHGPEQNIWFETVNI